MNRKIISDAQHAVISTRDLLRDSASFIVQHKIILIYPLLATFITLFTLPIISGFIAATIATFVSLLNIDIARTVIALIAATLLVFYISVVSGIFTCLIVSAVSVRLEHSRTILFAGLVKAIPRWRRVLQFSIASPLFGVIYLLTSRPRSPGQVWTMITTSLSINTALVAPGIINTDRPLVNTLHDSTTVLRRGWKQQLLFKGLVYVVVITLAFASFLPSYIAEKASSIDPDAESAAKWIVSAVIWVLLFIATKVISSVFTTILYHRMK